VTSDIGATPSGRWQFSQLRCRIGAMSFVNVTSRVTAPCWAVTVNGTATPDTINITANAGAVEVSGLAALVRITHPEAANDSLTVNGLGGTDTIITGAGVTTLIGVTVNQ